MKRGFLIILLAAGPVLADDVILRGGGQITGEIVERTEDFVTVDIGGGTITAKTSSIVRIEENRSPLQEYRERAAGIEAGDTEAWRELGRWAKRNALSIQAQEAYVNVIESLPDDDEANRALGWVKLNGKWVDEEESYRARGFVKFEHNWMKPAERQKILEHRRAREAQERREIEAEIRAVEASQAEDKRREAKEEAERKKRYNQLPGYGDPIGWGWGAYQPRSMGGK